MKHDATDQLVFESFDLIGSTTICGISYGIALTLYFICARSMCLRLRRRDEHRWRNTLLWLGFISLAMLCATIYLVMDSRTIQMAYINNRDQAPGGPINYERVILAAQNIHILAPLTFIIVALLTMFVQVSFAKSSMLRVNNDRIPSDLAFVGDLERDEICYRSYSTPFVAFRRLLWSVHHCSSRSLSIFDQVMSASVQYLYPRCSFCPRLPFA